MHSSPDRVTEPVRAADSGEATQLARARNAGPFVAWRDEQTGALRTRAITSHTPATFGRSTNETLQTDHPLVSREHAEVTVRVHGFRVATTVYLLDYSKHGTEHRRVSLTTHGVAQRTGQWRKAPEAPARAWQLDDGAHDVRLAGQLCVLIDGVPVDNGRTGDRDDNSEVPAPTVRQRLVLVELCRPFFKNPGTRMMPPSNAELALAVADMNEERVRNLIGEMYRRYGISGSGGPRLALVDIALKHDLVDATDFL
jgi:hypothetical protein